MNSISISKMEQVNGGMKCIYHGIIAGVATVGLGLVGAGIYALIDGGNLVKCWNNSH